MKSETDDGLSSCSNFLELESDKPVLPEIEHLKGNIGEGDFESLRAVLNWIAVLNFQNIRRISVVVTSSNSKLN